MMGRDAVLFRGRGFRSLTQLVAEVFLAFFGVILFLGGLSGIASNIGSSSFLAPFFMSLSIASFLIGLVFLSLFYLIYIDGRIWHRKRITVYRSGIDVNGSYIRWDQVKGVYHDVAEEATWLGPYNIPTRYELVHTVEVESVDGRRLVFRLKERDFQRFLDAVVEALGEDEAANKVKKQ